MKKNEKHIKKIDEFLNFDFPYGEIDKVMTSKEIEVERLKYIEIEKTNIKNLGIKSSKPNMNIDDYRERISIRKSMGNCDQTDEELNEYCIKKFGEPFIKK